ncbi:MAG: His/Gly/Thr/Pro-type tRNA ligase C-terminal domain-containing protein, partial [Actinomycetota bacterium]
LGVDRTLLACDDEGVFESAPRQLDAFVVDVVDGTHALALTTEFRRAGLTADRAYDGRSMKAQMKLANRSGARAAVIIGADEVATDTVQLKPLFGGDQRSVPRGEIAAQLRESTSS